MPLKNYNLFSTEEFLLDNEFVRYVHLRRPEDALFWAVWKENLPPNLRSFQEAELQLNLIYSDSAVPIPEGFQESLLFSINNSINNLEKTHKARRFLATIAIGIASCLALLVGISWYFMSSITIKAEFGERKNVLLPDGSQIWLNSNSTLTYPRAFLWKTNREINLNGEAYFRVKHLNTNTAKINKGDIFSVQAGELEIRVLGTEFNVKQRGTGTVISLIKGRISVTNPNQQKTIMSPGEVFEARSGIQSLLKRQGLADKVDWLSGKMVMQQVTVNDILADFKDLYGYQVVLDSPQLGLKKIDGVISLKDEQNLLFTLKNILAVDIKKDGKVIYMKSKKN